MKEAAGKEAGKDADQRFWVLFASVKSKEMTDKLKANPLDAKARVELVRKAVADARTALEKKGALLLVQRAIANDVVVLYEKEPAMAEAVKDAKALVAQIDKKMPPRLKR